MCRLWLLEVDTHAKLKLKLDAVCVDMCVL